MVLAQRSGKVMLFVLPSREKEFREAKTDEGASKRMNTDEGSPHLVEPSSGVDFVHATFRRSGRREEAPVVAQEF